MKNYQTIILSNLEISPGYWRMRILAPGFAAAAAPGQFVMLRPELALPTMLRRPFGIFRTGCLPPECAGLPPREYMEILYKIVGQGTRIMSDLHAGDRVELLGPLGRGFTINDTSCAKILVGGGIGLVPLFLLAEALIDKGHQVRLLMGGRTRDDVLAVTEFERLGVETYVSTDDGSLGEEGLVTKVLERKLSKYPCAEVYACGPMPMLAAVERICSERNVPLQVSLESHMACGVGACLGCVVKGAGHSDQRPNYLCTCKEGPVFAAGQLDWGRAVNTEGGCPEGGCR
ncbi:MAG: dihydroorotate dehydrogenase electron transfer subunit [Desulfuromonas sp.]|nr:dihydroorotate dehydrogenase electron transfer subunit [Desulfuromonas sp.]